MKKIGWLALLLALAGCSHEQHNQAQAEAGRAPVSEEAAVTGLPTPVYPRALPVILPAASATPATPAGTVADVPPVVTNSAPAPSDGEVPIPTAMGAPAVTVAPPATNTDSVVTASPDVATQAPADSSQVVVVQTSLGRMILELDDFAAPKTCANFRRLVTEGFYNGTIFHRVIPHFIIQGGDPNTKTENRTLYGKGDPGYTLPPEIKLQHDQGAVAMARLPDSVNPQRNSNGSQFYICLAACPSLDDQYTVFAHVIQGLDVANRIAGVPRDNRDDPVEHITMEAHLEPRGQALQESATSSTANP